MAEEPGSNGTHRTADAATDPAGPKLAGLRLPRYPQAAYYIFLSFLAFVVVRYIQLGARKEILATVRFEFLVGLIVIALAVSHYARHKPDFGDSRSLLIAISLLFFFMIVQLPFAASPATARAIFMDRVIKFAFLTFFMIVFIESPRYLQLFVAAFLFSVFYITLEAVEGLISGSLLWQNQGVMRLHGAVPIYRHPNSLGGVATGALPFVMFLFPVIRSWKYKIGLLAVATTSTLCVVYSGSRTAYVGLLALILWWWFQSPNKLRFLAVGVVAGAITLTIIPTEYIERFQSIGGGEKEGHSSEKRIEILEDAITIFAENPLGVGIASFPAVRFQRFGREQDTHNLYLEVGTNLGVQGLAAFLFLIFAMMVQFRRSAMSFRWQRIELVVMFRAKGLHPRDRAVIAKHEYDLRFLIAMAKAAGGFILTRLVLGMFGMDLYEVYWWFGAGLAIVLAGLVVSTKRNTKAIVTRCRKQGTSPMI